MKKLTILILGIALSLSVNAQIIKPKNYYKSDSIKITYDINNPLYKSGKHLRAASYCELGSIAFGTLAGVSIAALDDKTGKVGLGAMFGAGALACYIARIVHLNKSGQYLKITGTQNGVGVQYNFGGKSKSKRK